MNSEDKKRTENSEQPAKRIPQITKSDQIENGCCACHSGRMEKGILAEFDLGPGNNSHIEISSQPYFQQIATEWENMRRSFFSESVREKAYRAAGIEPGKVAADLGAGSGFMTEGLLRAGLKVIAVDQSSNMIKEMRRRFAENENVEYCLGDAHSLPLPDGSVDYVFANMYLHHVESPVRAIKEMRRILKPGGKLVIVDLEEHNYEFLKTDQHDRWLGFRRHGILNWFRAAGLKNISVSFPEENCCSSSACGRGPATIRIFLASGEAAEQSCCI